MIREICEDHRNTHYIDTERYFTNANGLPRAELFLDDRLHLNDEGYRVWSGVIKNELDKILMK